MEVPVQYYFHTHIFLSIMACSFLSACEINGLTFHRDVHLGERRLMLNFSVWEAKTRSDIGAVKIGSRMCSRGSGFRAPRPLGS